MASVKKIPICINIFLLIKFIQQMNKTKTTTKGNKSTVRWQDKIFVNVIFHGPVVWDDAVSACDAVVHLNDTPGIRSVHTPLTANWVWCSGKLSNLIDWILALVRPTT